ncbi:MAG TPA: hypothetical protein VGB24_08260 [Longimicrobium sp.]|jgi:hypothetical protein|uniref:DUF6886 family protein n=1 Tax=Longimicrobium sp. TaxID=2029185 RepID=UPI002ED789ED
MLFHVSEGEIGRFEPRPTASADAPVVWAVDGRRLHNYLLPRDCPRVTFYAGPGTIAEDAERFLGTSPAVVAVESAWLERIRACVLYCHHLPSRTFECLDESAGYFVGRDAVVPERVEVIDDVITELLARGVELRFLPSLWHLHDAVAASSLRFSMIRMRIAAPR